jgi:hypothetical protein
MAILRRRRNTNQPRRPVFDRLFALLGTLGNFDSLKDKIALLGVVANALRKLPGADSSKEYHEIAVTILEGLAPLTATPLDDGALIAARALALSDEWHTWIDAQLAASGPAVETVTEGLAPGIPEGALAITMPPEVSPPDWARNQAQAISLGSLASLMQYLPMILELIRELRREKKASDYDMAG